MSNLPAVAEKQQDNKLQYITFFIGEELFGIEISSVKEVLTPRPVTIIPRTPDYLMGIVNLRGEVISIIDLRVRFKMPAQSDTPKSRIIVVMSQGMKVGLLIDSVNAIMTQELEDLRPTSMLTASETQKYISGSFKLSDNDILLILSQDELIVESDFHHHQKASKDQSGLTVVKEEEKKWSREINLVGFSIQGERYSIESLLVEEIIFKPELTVIPEMDKFVEGMFYLRDSAIPLIRLGDRLELNRSEVGEDTPVIIVNVFSLKIGLMVDEITEVFTITEDDIRSAPIHISKAQSDQLKGVIKVTREEESYIVMLLKLEKLFSFEEQDLLKEIDSMHDTEVELKTEKEKSAGNMSIFEFILDNERYAIEISQTNEIIQIREFVPVPKAPPFIKGIINLRGEVVSVVDLPKLVDHKDYEIDQFAKLLIVNTGSEVVGLIVERIMGIRKVNADIFEAPSEILKQKGNIFIKGIGRDPKSESIIILMDIETTLIQAQAADESDELASLQYELEMLEEEDQRADHALLESSP